MKAYECIRETLWNSQTKNYWDEGGMWWEMDSYRLNKEPSFSRGPIHRRAIKEGSKFINRKTLFLYHRLQGNRNYQNQAIYCIYVFVDFFLLAV